MDWKETLKKIIENGCTDSNIEDFVDEHPDVDAKEIWDYAYEYNAPEECKGCRFIQLSGMMPCTNCSRRNKLKDYYMPREKTGNTTEGQAFSQLLSIADSIKNGENFIPVDDGIQNPYTRVFTYWQDKMVRLEEELTFAEVEKVADALRILYEYFCKMDSEFKESAVLYY